MKVKEDFPKEGRSGKSGKGFSANIGNLPNGIKKIALVSFFVFDPGMTSTWSTSAYIYTKKVNTGGFAPEIAGGAYASVLEPMKTEFKALGMELLTPEQFLDSEDKKQFYNSFQVEHDKSFANWVGKFGASNHDQMYGYPEGYIIADIVKEPFANYEKSGLFQRRKADVPDGQIYFYDKDTKMTETLGYNLCTKLGVDAVLVSYMTVYMPNKKKIELVNVRFQLFGPNPNPPEGESKHTGLIPHVKGLFYYGASVIPETLIYSEKKKDPESLKLNFTGFDLIYTALVREFGEYYKNKTKK